MSAIAVATIAAFKVVLLGKTSITLWSQIEISFFESDLLFRKMHG